MRKLTILALAASAALVEIHAQNTSPSSPQFEAASIKLNNRCLDAGLPPAQQNAPGRLVMRCMPITSAIQSAYVIYKDGQPPVSLGSTTPIQGGPDWLSSDLYDIDAVATGAPRQEVMRGPMLRRLLEDRFKLNAHLQTREIPVYALTLANGGLKLTRFVEGSCTPQGLNAVGPRPDGQAPLCTTASHPIPPEYSTVLFESKGMTLDAFAMQLGLILDRPVLNKTGIQGRFDFHLEFAIDQTTPRFVRPSTPSSQKGSVFGAIQDQLGLKLEPARGPGEFLVIDHVERPTEN